MRFHLKTTNQPSTFYTDCWENCFNSANAVVSSSSSGSGSAGTGGLAPGTSLQNEYNQIYNLIEAARTTRMTSG